jgi:hypothetical protein
MKRFAVAATWTDSSGYTMLKALVVYAESDTDARGKITKRLQSYKFSEINVNVEEILGE